VGDVEGTPLVVSKRKRECVPLAQVEKVGLSGGVRLPAGLGELLGVALDGQNAGRVPGGPGDGTAELGKPAADVENSLASPEVQLAQAGFVEQDVQPGQSLLLGRVRTVDVARWLLIAW